MQGVPQFASPAKLARLKRAMSGGHSQDRVRPIACRAGRLLR